GQIAHRVGTECYRTRIATRYFDAGAALESRAEGEPRTLQDRAGEKHRLYPRRLLSARTRTYDRGSRHVVGRTDYVACGADLSLQSRLLRMSFGKFRPRPSPSRPQLSTRQKVPRIRPARSRFGTSSDAKLTRGPFSLEVNLALLADRFEENFTQRGELGASVSVWRDGEEIVSLGAGWQDREHT